MARNRLTLLEVVQRTLDAMNHDNVNGISDTVESAQIAEEARVVYYELMDTDDWPHLMKLQPLESVVDVTRPNFLQIPEDVVRIEDIRYETTLSGETQRQFKKIHYLAPSAFITRLLMNNIDNTNVITVPTFENVDLFVIDDMPPQHWTSFDDDFIVFDSYDSGVDTTLQGGKSLALTKEIPPWTSADTFIPDMPDQMFSVFLAEVTASAFTYWKQGQSIKDEQRAARGRSRLRKDARKIDERDFKAKFGRKRNSIITSADGTRGSIRASLGI